MVPGYLINRFIRATDEDFPNNFFYCVHPSLLPKYRGACPIQHTLLNGESKTGVSIIHLSKRTFDAGNIVLQTDMGIKPQDTYGTLRNSLADLGGELVSDLLNGNPEDFNRDSIAQSNKMMTKAPLFEGETFNLLDFENLNSEEIMRIFKAFTGSSRVPFSKIHVKGDSRVIVFDDLELADLNNDQDQKAINRFEHLNIKIGEYKMYHKANREQM